MRDTRTPEQLISEAARLLERARELNTQVTDEQLETMTADQINQARRDGRLTSILKNGN
jgi:RNase H-fold protein (predicted Holliday junction resolvase)